MHSQMRSHQKIQILKTTALAILLLTFSSCMGGATGARKASKGGPEPIVVPAGTQVPALGLAFDLSYDPELDNLIPGYRILQVGITNGSLKVAELRPLDDRWYVIDRRGRRHSAVINLRLSDPDTWKSLPDRLKQLIEYPLFISVGESFVIDLLFPDRVELGEFGGVVFESVGLDKIIQIFARGSTR